MAPIFGKFADGKPVIEVPDKFDDRSIPPQSLVHALTPQSISYPTDRHLHIITDAELDALMKAATPVQAGIALTAIGAAVPSLPGSLPAFNAIIEGKDATTASVAWLLIFVATLVTAITCGWNAWRGKSDAATLAEQIRSRETMPLAPDPVHRDQPSNQA